MVTSDLSYTENATTSLLCLKFSNVSHSLWDKSTISESCYAIPGSHNNPNVSLSDHSAYYSSCSLITFSFWKILFFLPSQVHHSLSGLTFPPKTFRFIFDITFPYIQLISSLWFTFSIIALISIYCINLIHYLSTYWVWLCDHCLWKFYLHPQESRRLILFIY